jgi:hypothetical protein
MIKINEPRYHDRVVLIARYRIPCGQDFTIQILKGAYAGEYKVSNEVICASPIESMKTRSGKQLSMRAVPLDKLERIK